MKKRKVILDPPTINKMIVKKLPAPKLPPVPRPTYNELRDKARTLLARVARLEAEVARLTYVCQRQLEEQVLPNHHFTGMQLVLLVRQTLEQSTERGRRQLLRLIAEAIEGKHNLSGRENHGL